ncbi:DNA-protecting protein DprA [Rothia amarae]|uniref:DNA-protecting protein DprA n=1 Tax=Rothia amarae TaxID=169480 RepID=A0A7H2BMB4_9MICC|nr:DNA-processing protein DprA [Rothia amarae]QNV40810.1 DNA-protecting protein DprA [Rothia amarae]SIJ65001.1 DNA protecting protein DprA [Mycobacteroides abscessus subsp. abscessus]
MMTPEHSARAEIVRIAEPEDPYINLCIEMLGPLLTADLLTQRQEFTPGIWEQRTETDAMRSIPVSDLQKVHEALGNRIERWSLRSGKVNTDQEFRMAGTLDSWFCIPEDSDWPRALDDLGEKKPYGIWGRGDRSKLNHLTLPSSVAVVGSRDITSYGTSATAHIVGDLVEREYCIVSGGAFGIDAVAHRTALSVTSGKLPSVALMACGVDRPYPKQNENLLRELINEGLLLSEVALGNSPTRWRFLQRNRLIAALSGYSLIVEARWRSGALNTANHALSLGREVGIVPGHIFSPNSEGCHRLAKKELAHVVTDAQDIVSMMQTKFTPEEETLDIPLETGRGELPKLSEVQSRVWDALPLRRPAPLENIALMSGLDIRTTMLTLSQLAAKGVALNQNQGWSKSQ